MSGARRAPSAASFRALEARLDPVCEYCTRPAAPKDRHCAACCRLASSADDLDRAIGVVPGAPRFRCEADGCPNLLPPGNDHYCCRACASIASSERILVRLEANGVATKRTRAAASEAVA